MISIESIHCTGYASCIPSVDIGTGTVLSRGCIKDSDCTTDGKGGNNGTAFPDCCTNTAIQRKACFSKGLQIQGWTCP